MMPPDNHVHSEWSYDAAAWGSMDRTCARAIELGLPSVAFTEHVDFTAWGAGDRPRTPAPSIDERDSVRPLDIVGYHESVRHCRDRYPDLRILSGIEAGEPHLFAGSVAAVLGAGPFDRVLGSLHSVHHEGLLIDPPPLFRVLAPEVGMRRYLTEMIDMIEGSDVFEILAHVD